MKTLAPLMSVLALLAAALIGCVSKDEGADSAALPDSPPATVATTGAHNHPTEGPHGGDLIELGNEEYHAELVHPHGHDDDAGAKGATKPDSNKGEAAKDAGDEHAEHSEVLVYILDSAAKNAVPIDAADVTINVSHDGKPEQFTLAAEPAKTDPQGKSSCFSSSDKELLEHFHDEHIDGTLVVVINGKSYRGKLAHNHNEAAHKH